MHSGAGREAPPVIFLHIPKTAGSTVYAALKLLHGPHFMRVGNVFSNPDRCRELAWQMRHDPSVRVAAGHTLLALRPLYPPEARWATMLRDPVERTLSHYYYYCHHLAASGDTSPEDLTLQHCVEKGYLVDNLQTRILSGGEFDAAASEEMLAAAKENLRGFAAVGLAEEFDRSLALLYLTFGWPTLLVRDVRVNASRPPRAAHSEADLEAVRRANELDLELYAEARALFEAALARLGDRLLIEAAAIGRARSLLAAESPESGDGPASGLVEERARAIAAETRRAAFHEVAEVGRDILLDAKGRAAKLERELRAIVAALRRGQVDRVELRLTKARAKLGRLDEACDALTSLLERAGRHG